MTVVEAYAALRERQINEKGYAECFQCDGHSIVKVGVNFSTACCNINKCVVE